MTKDFEFHLREIKSKLSQIVGKVQNNVNRNNDGGAGDTLEKLLGVKINNLKIPDYGGVIELKTAKVQRQSNSASTSYLTLFHREPMNTGESPTFPLVCKALGWKHSGICSKRDEGACKATNGHIKLSSPLYKSGVDGFGRNTGRCYPEDELSFRSTTRFKPTSRGIYLEIEGDELHMCFDPALVNRDGTPMDEVSKKIGGSYGVWLDDVDSREPHWSEIFPLRYNLKFLYGEYCTKMANSLFATFSAKSNDGRRQGTSPSKIMFQEAYMLGDPISKEEFKNLLKTGILVIDFDGRTRHNHGCKLRIHPKYIPQLFNQVEKIAG